MDPAALDAADPLRCFRERFALPEGKMYLDGNSLGCLPRETPQKLANLVDREWGENLIGSWNDAGWVSAPERVGAKIARLVGAADGEVVACDSTSVNVFKALCAALSVNQGRSTILSERGNFPTDVYMMQGLETLTGGRVRSRLVDPEEVIGAIDEDTAAILLTQVHYRTGRIRDMATTTAAAHAKGALAIWDLSHSAGAIPVDLNAARADFAVGCGYKFLNGGPGAPGYIFVAERHQADAIPALSGWFGHARPFDFEDRYEPAPGITRFLAGTPPILGLAALEVGVDLMLEADMAEVRAKSIAMGSLFTALMEPLCAAHGFALASPSDPNQRGSQVSYSHPNAYPIVQALIARGVVGDFRAPDVLRFGLTPLYTSFAEIASAVDILRAVMDEGAWDRSEFHERSAVT
ncbi:Kynureninase [Tsuneonella dongtanensis]|uniref:Kynureninase n=1 Tax=Tsuneonella dongtanensis TaxID=692370 RepID=A0A1B2AFV7_9SPHN|nr:kynureninase [Tsuneonella dongtanensis]ANY21001.1 Kynureninase [Tsuneonella dongtanensis]